MQYRILSLWCCPATGLSGCSVAGTVGVAADLATSAAKAAVIVTGDAVETAVDVVTPENEERGEDADTIEGEEERRRDTDHGTPDAQAPYDAAPETSPVDRPRPRDGSRGRERPAQSIGHIRMSDIETLIAGATAGAPYGKHLGFECIELAADRAVFRLPFHEHNVTVGDMVHGGAIASLADTAATAACWSTPRLPDNPRGSTIGFSISYLNAAHGTDLTAEAGVIRRGGSVCVVDVWVRMPSGEPVARATVTYKLSGGRRT